MQSSLRRRIRHLRRLLGYGALVVLILAATAVGALNQLLPLVERHPGEVAAWLSQRLGEPVAFDAAHASWTRRGPRFILDGLRIGGSDRALDIGRAELLVAVYSGLLPGAPLTELKVRDLTLSLEQGGDGRWKLAGLPFEPRPGVDPLDTLEALGELQVEHARLQVRSPALAAPLDLPRLDLRLRVYGESLRAGVRLWADPAGGPLSAAAELSRSDWRGMLWAGGEGLSLGQWSPLLADTGLVFAGQADLDLWARIDHQRVMDVRTRATLAPLAISARTPWHPGADGRLHSPPAAFERADVLARWQVDANGWQLHAPELHFHERGRESPRSLDGLWLAGGEVHALQAPRLDLAPARALAVLSDKLPDGLRQWLQRAAPDGELRDVRVAGRAGDWSGSARVYGLGWQAQEGRPGLQGLSGSAAFDQDGGVLRVDAPLRFEWDGFRQPLAPHVAGTLGWWRDGGAWTLGAAGLRIRGEDYGTTLRAEVAFPAAGGKPRLDLAADVAPATVVAARRFWVVGKMPQTAIDWLDRALQSGDVLDGRAVIGGDLAHWPFREGQGRFDARARVEGATIAFNPDWPAADDMALEVVFDGPGFAVEGRGAILGNPVGRIAGGITDFRDPVLALDVESRTRGQALQALLRASPMAERFGEHLRVASVHGPVRVDMTLDLPLAARLGPRRLAGVLALERARLADPRWDLQLDDVRGETRFTEGGFLADALEATFEDQPVRFTLAVGADTRDPAIAARAVLEGRLPADVLLRRHPPLAWLQPHLPGASDWRVRVEVPAPGDGPALPSRLQVSSTLEGTAITLPAPLDKPAGAAWPLQLDAALPVDAGVVRVSLAEHLRLNAHIADDGAMSGLLQFGAGADLPVPGPGLAVRGQAERLDAAGWIGVAGSGGEGEGAGALRSVDLQVRVLDLLGSPFEDTRVRLSREPALTQVRLDGAAIEGEVDVPADRRRAIEGRFARLHWPARPAPQDGAPPVEPSGPDQDPGRLPPLAFRVEDLRVGALALGGAELRAVPRADGLRIERFATRAPTFELTAQGDWRRTGEGRAASEFQVDFRAGSLGELLGAFGLAGMVDEGPTTGVLRGRWPGSPGAFALARFTGTLRAEVGEGALLEVEPGGGGRVLGLISLAEIPRRLTLDFKDFFNKGFGFNSISGEFVFADGTARTDLLQINGPAAEIRVSGSTDLRAQTYDQRIEVLPKAGGVLPALGALAGGPVGAAVGAVAQAVLQQPLKQAARTVYRVTGPWKDPEVEVIEKGPPAADAGERPSPP